MPAAVPGNVDESDQLPARPSADPAETVTLDLTPPVVVVGRVFEALGVQGFYFSAVKSPRQR